ncbi:MAG: hypothetical protein A3J52_02400 [Omnitrophica bacterium RIFCSPHIGHO2_02_FULL_49_9]|nr:MAG: hypothetical protein A3J52_02400 [Omnitrophica bacterium RIFCSPHIGHO2_02_FULL_49_9]
MKHVQVRLSSLRHFLFGAAALAFAILTSSAWMAEWLYPLDTSSLWTLPQYRNLDHEIYRARLALRFAPQDPRYLYQLGKLYADKMPSESLTYSPGGATDRAVRDMKDAIRYRPVVAEHHAGFALFLQKIAAAESRLPGSRLTSELMELSEEEVNRALFLSPMHHGIRAYAATYYQYRGQREKSLALWRSILEEDPAQTSDILKQCFKFYGDHSFLPEVAPRANIDQLVRFQYFLITFRPDGWGEEGHLATLPVLMETSRQSQEENLSLIEIIGKSYWSAKKYDDAYLWYRKGFERARTDELRAPFLRDAASILLQQGKIAEARAALEPYLALSSVDGEILVLYAQSVGYLGDKTKAIEWMKQAVAQKDPKPNWRLELASMLFDVGQYGEAVREWQTSLEEIAGTNYEADYRAKILLKIGEAQEKM